MAPSAVSDAAMRMGVRMRLPDVGWPRGAWSRPEPTGRLLDGEGEGLLGPGVRVVGVAVAHEEHGDLVLALGQALIGDLVVDRRGVLALYAELHRELAVGAGVPGEVALAAVHLEVLVALAGLRLLADVLRVDREVLRPDGHRDRVAGLLGLQRRDGGSTGGAGGGGEQGGGAQRGGAGGGETAAKHQGLLRSFVTRGDQITGRPVPLSSRTV